MRYDFEIDTNTYDLVFAPYSDTPLSDFIVVKENDTNVVGKVLLSNNWDIEEPFCLTIPYTPIYKPLVVEMYRGRTWVDCVPIINPTTNVNLYKIYSEGKEIKLSEYIVIDNIRYVLRYVDGRLILGTYNYNDLSIVNANIQNRDLLLLCVPGNSYRFPVSGVGLIKYLHSNIKHTDLAYRLDSEFMEERVKVLDAVCDTNTGELSLNLDYSEADENI